MDDLFRLDGARHEDPAIDVWLSNQPSALGAIAKAWFMRMRACGDDVLELMHDGCPVVCVEDAPFAYVDVFTAHVNVGFFHGNALPDPAGLLLGSGKYMRHVKIKPGREPELDALTVLIDAAYADIRERLAGG